MSVHLDSSDYSWLHCRKKSCSLSLNGIVSNFTSKCHRYHSTLPTILNICFHFVYYSSIFKGKGHENLFKGVNISIFLYSCAYLPHIWDHWKEISMVAFSFIPLLSFEHSLSLSAQGNCGQGEGSHAVVCLFPSLWLHCGEWCFSWTFLNWYEFLSNGLIE